MEALGREFDISVGSAPIDWNTAGSTGKRVSLRNATGCTIVATFGVAAAGTDSLVFTLQQHTAATSGTTANLAIVDHFYIKYAATLAGTETWVRAGQTASQTITLADTLTQTLTAGPGITPVATGFAAKQGILVVEVDAAQLADTYAYVSLSIADPGSGGARLGSILYFLHDLNVTRDAIKLPAALA